MFSLGIHPVRYLFIMLDFPFLTQNKKFKVVEFANKVDQTEAAHD